MSEENKAIINRLIQELNKGNLDICDELYAEDFVNHGASRDRDSFKKAIGGQRKGFPDVQYTIEHLIAEGEMVVNRFTFEGTHQGEFRGIPPTGKQVSFKTVAIVRITNGKIVETWSLADTMSLMQQLGVIPT